MHACMQRCSQFSQIRQGTCSAMHRHPMLVDSAISDSCSTYCQASPCMNTEMQSILQGRAGNMQCHASTFSARRLGDDMQKYGSRYATCTDFDIGFSVLRTSHDGPVIHPDRKELLQAYHQRQGCSQLKAMQSAMNRAGEG